MTNDLSLTRRQALAGGAALLGCAAAALPVPALAAPFVSRRIAVTVRGQGPDVLLIPGLASGASVWSGTVAAVPGYRYHLVQVRGFAGLAPDLNRTGALIDPLANEIARYVSDQRLSRPAIVGHSMGGTLAMLLALRVAPAIGRVMVVDMLPEGAAMVGGTASGMGYLADQMSQYFTQTKAGRQLFADMLAQQPGAKGSDPDVIAHALTELAHVDLSARLPALRPPLSVAYAVPGDARTRQALASRYRSAYAGKKGATLLPIGPSGHMVMLDRPAEFAAALRGFLRG